MPLEKIVDTSSVWFNDVWRIYESSFPADERRDLQGQIDVLRNPQYTLFAFCAGRDVQGLLAVWDFDAFSFIEHFAVREELRSKWIGTSILQSYLSKTSRTGRKIVLETEMPEASEIAQRRVRFYERLGFVLNRHNYIQPAYSAEKKPVPLFLMSYPTAINEAEFIEIRRMLHTTVYNCKEPLT